MSTIAMELTDESESERMLRTERCAEVGENSNVGDGVESRLAP